MADAALHISALGADSLDAIEAISLRAFDHRYGEAWSKAQCLSVLALPGYRIIGAWRRDTVTARLVGYAITRSVADESELLLLAVDPAERRQGVAAALLSAWLNSCYEDGIVRTYLEMRTDNDARSLYQAHGFVEIAVRTSYYRGNDGVMRDAVTMQRRLDSSPIDSIQ